MGTATASSSPEGQANSVVTYPRSSPAPCDIEDQTNILGRRTTAEDGFEALLVAWLVHRCRRSFGLGICCQTEGLIQVAERFADTVREWANQPAPTPGGMQWGIDCSRLNGS